MKIRMASLLAIACFVLFTGCAPSRSYSEGVLAANDTHMSPDELQNYSVKLDQEMDRVSKGGAVPAGVTREVYLEDLKERQRDIKTRIMMIEHFKQKDEFDDKYPSS